MTDEVTPTLEWVVNALRNAPYSSSAANCVSVHHQLRDAILSHLRTPRVEAGDGGAKWRCAWLIEKRGLPRAMWLMASGDWTFNSNDALQFAREADAEAFRVASGNEFVRIVVCEHAFMVSPPTDTASRALASEDGAAVGAAGAWVPWKPGDALPADPFSYDVFHVRWTDEVTIGYHSGAIEGECHVNNFELCGVIAYYKHPPSVPREAPPPYAPSPPEGGRT